jgi:hypothetical protein
MVTVVTKYQANDGSFYDTNEAAIEHENNIRIARMASALACAMDISDGRLNEDMIVRRVIESFNNRNSRNLIKDLLSATLTPANE